MAVAGDPQAAGPGIRQNIKIVIHSQRHENHLKALPPYHINIERLWVIPISPSTEN